MTERLMSFVGIATLLGLAWLLSNNRKAIRLKPVVAGMVLQLVLGALLLAWAPGRAAFQSFSDGVAAFLSLSDRGAQFLFGNLARGEHFFPQGGFWPGFGFQFAFKVLPTIIFFSAVMSILYYLGIMQIVIKGMARAMQKVMGTSGSETLSCTANIFVGQTEAPLLVKPFLSGMTKSELLTIMVGGFATVAGGVLAGYIAMGVNAGHLVVASVLSAALPSGEFAGWFPGSLRTFFGTLLSPLAFLMGVPWADAPAVGNLLGIKLSVNEFVGYSTLAEAIQTHGMGERAQVIATYALCGFANFSSIGIQIGGIGALAPERRGDLARLGFKAMLGGAIASWITACVAGLMI